MYLIADQIMPKKPFLVMIIINLQTLLILKNFAEKTYKAIHAATYICS